MFTGAVNASSGLHGVPIASGFDRVFRTGAVKASAVEDQLLLAVFFPCLPDLPFKQEGEIDLVKFNVKNQVVI